MTTYSLSPIFNGFQGFNDGGVPLSGGLLYVYLAGTTTPTPTYTDSIGGTANSNPIVMGGNGRPPQEVWLSDSLTYKYVLKTSSGSVLGTYDNIASINKESVIFTQSSGSSLVGYQPAGTGAVSTNVQAKLRENVSVLDFGMSPSDSVGTANASALLLAFEACRVLNNSGVCPILEIPAGNYLVSFTRGQSDTNPFNTPTINAAKAFYNFTSSNWNSRTPTFSSGDDKGMMIVGIGRPVITINGDANSYFLTTDGYFTLDIENVTFRDSSSASSIATHCLSLYQMVHSFWKKVTIENFQNGVGVFMPTCTDNNFKGFYAYQNQRALVLGGITGSMSSAASQAIHFDGFEITNNGTNVSQANALTTGCIEINGVQNCSFENGVFQNNYIPKLIRTADGINFKNVYFEDSDNGQTFPAAGIASVNFGGNQSYYPINGGGSTTIQGVAFDSCYMDANLLFLIRAGTATRINGISVTDCTFGTKYQSLAYCDSPSELGYMTGIQYYNSPIYTSSTQATLVTALPTQYTIASGATGSTSLGGGVSTRVMPIYVFAQGYSMGLMPNYHPSAVRATLSSTITNATGSGVAYNVVWNTTSASFNGDGNGDMNTTTGVFTAPVSGYYQISGSVECVGCASSNTTFDVGLYTNGTTYKRLLYGNPYAIVASSLSCIPFATVANLSAGETVQMQITVGGGTQIIGIGGDSYFSCHLIS